MLKGPPPPSPLPGGEIERLGGDTPLPGSIGMLHLPFFSLGDGENKNDNGYPTCSGKNTTHPLRDLGVC
jgi:hypothetical protein